MTLLDEIITQNELAKVHPVNCKCRKCKSAKHGERCQCEACQVRGEQEEFSIKGLFDWSKLYTPLGTSGHSIPGLNPFGERGGGRIKNKQDPPAKDICQIRRAYPRGRKKTVPIHCAAKDALDKMIHHARRDGIRSPLLYPTSAYRSFQHQKRLWDRGLRKRGGDARENSKWVARPGSSPHQSGRAVDLWLGARFSTKPAGLKKLRRTKAYRWMKKNARDYGFYPYWREPWHWEYNPDGSERYVNFRGGQKPAISTTTITTSNPTAKMKIVAKHWGTKNKMAGHIRTLVLSALPKLRNKRYSTMRRSERSLYRKTWKKIRLQLIELRKKLVLNGFVPPLGGPKVPYGFKKTKTQRGLYSDYRFISTIPRLDSSLANLYRQGKLQISQEELDVFQRIANVETSGRVTTLNTYDGGVVSIGFMQFTLHVGKIQKWIKAAANSFKKYGIELDSTLKYRFGRNGTHPAIKGIPKSRINELRWNGWAERFYYASLDPDIITAQVDVARFHLNKHLKRLKGRLKDDTIYNAFYQNYYSKDPYVKGLFQASYNNNPYRATKAVKKAILIVGKQPQSVQDFLDAYKKSLISVFSRWRRLVKVTAKGTTIKL